MANLDVRMKINPGTPPIANGLIMFDVSGGTLVISADWNDERISLDIDSTALDSIRDELDALIAKIDDLDIDEIADKLEELQDLLDGIDLDALKDILDDIDDLRDHSKMDNLAYDDSGHTGFAPTTHSHTKSQITDFDHEHAIDDIIGLDDELDDLRDELRSEFPDERDFTVDPILETELGSGAVTDSKIGTRAVLDNVGTSAAPAINAKNYTTWLQAIRDSLKGAHSRLDAVEDVETLYIDGMLLTRIIGGSTDVPKNLFPINSEFIDGKTLAYDENGTLGFVTEEVDSSTISIETITISPISSHEPRLLGEVATYADLPSDISEAETEFGVTPEVGDYVRITADENAGGVTTERAIIYIDTSDDLTWGNAVILNVGDYQEQTTAAMAGLVLTGGAQAGRFGAPLGVDSVPTENSTNLISSNAVFEIERAVTEKIDDVNIEIADITTEITDINTELSELTTGITDINTEITDINNEITNITTDIVDINNELEQLDSNIGFASISAGSGKVSAVDFKNIRFNSQSPNATFGINNDIVELKVAPSGQKVRTFVAAEDFILPASLPNLLMSPAFDYDNNVMHCIGSSTGSVTHVEVDMLTGERITSTPYPFSVFGVIATYHDGFVYAFGNQAPMSDRCFKFDVVDKTWTELDAMPGGNYCWGVARVIDSVIYIINPSLNAQGTGSGRILRFDIATETWLSTWNYPIAVRKSAAAVIGTDIYIFGGYMGTAGTNRVEKLDTLTGTFTQLANYPLAITHGNAVPDNRGNIIVASGWSGAANATVYRYSIADNNYTQLANRPEASYTEDAFAYKNVMYFPSSQATTNIRCITFEDIYIDDVESGEIVNSSKAITKVADDLTRQEIAANTNVVMTSNGELYKFYDNPIIAWSSSTASIQWISRLITGMITSDYEEIIPIGAWRMYSQDTECIAETFVRFGLDDMLYYVNNDFTASSNSDIKLAIQEDITAGNLTLAAGSGDGLTEDEVNALIESRAMTRGVQGTYTQGIDFDNGIITAQQWLDKNINYHWFDISGTTTWLNIIFNQPNSENLIIRDVLMVGLSTTNNANQMRIINTSATESTGSLRVYGVNALSFGGASYNGFGSAYFNDLFNLDGYSGNPLIYSNPIPTFSIDRAVRVNFGTTTMVKADTVNIGIGVTALLSGNIEVTNSFEGLGRITLGSASTLNISGSTDPKWQFRGNCMDERVGRGLETFQRKGEGGEGYTVFSAEPTQAQIDEIDDGHLYFVPETVTPGQHGMVNPNLLINGNFDIWQRGTSQTTSGYGSDDRWKNENDGTTKTHIRQAFADSQTSVPGYPRYYSRTVVNSVAGADNYCTKHQRIEDVRMASGQTITLSFWTKADSQRNIYIEFVQSFGTGSPDTNIIKGRKIDVDINWQKYVITIDVPQIGINAVNENSYFSCGFWFDAGSNHNSRTDNLGHQSGTFDIAQVKLEIGDKATPFVSRHIAEEIALCQRYYEIFARNSTVGAITGAILTNQFIYTAGLTFSTKRTYPTFTIKNNNLLNHAFGRGNGINTDLGTPIFVGSENTMAYFSLPSPVTGLTAGQLIHFDLMIDAEL